MYSFDTRYQDLPSKHFCIKAICFSLHIYAQKSENKFNFLKHSFTLFGITTIKKYSCEWYN